MNNYVLCAKNGQYCSLTGNPQNIYYGPIEPNTSTTSPGVFLDINRYRSPFTAQGQIMCNNSSFGVSGPEINDCYIRNSPAFNLTPGKLPQGYTLCANNDGICNNPNNYPVNVLYGADGFFTSAYIAPKQNIPCNVTKFGNSKLFRNLSATAACYYN